MVVRIVIAGVSQDDIFAEVCLVADYLAQHLPNFCWERLEKSVLDWEPWLLRVNQKNNWHHVGSPIIWKEMLLVGSKPFYIGRAADFLEYCYSYYDIDVFLAPEKIEGLTANFAQFKIKMKQESKKMKQWEAIAGTVEEAEQSEFVVTITGAAHALTMNLVSELLDMAVGEKIISKIYLYETDCSQEFMESVEHECSYVDTDNAGKVVKYIKKIGMALTHTDILIVLDHASYDFYQPIGDWLADNREIMKDLAIMINASARRKMYILFPNFGPACYNATILSQHIQLPKENIVVATADLGLDISATAAEIAEVPLRNMFCPPVWGFVGINHLVDINTTVHRYDTFLPYKRFLKVRNSTLMIGCLTPELRTMEYLMHFDETLWKRVAERKGKYSKHKTQAGFNKMIAVVNVVKEWLFERNPEHVVSLGINCNGSFGLTFNGKFSQPARFINEEWVPAEDYLLPKDPNMSLKYLQEMAELTMKLKQGELPRVVSYYPCKCKRTEFKDNTIWF